MALRALLLVLAVGLLAFAVVRVRDTERCADARHDVYSVGVYLTRPDAPSDAVAAAAARRLRADCDDPDAWVAGARSMLVSGHPELARTRARDATERQAQDISAWTALALAADATGERPLAAAARRRAAVLNPLG